MGMSSVIPVLFLFSIIVVNGAIVRDMYGQKLQASRNYYILPADQGMGGGLILAERNKTCPTYVAQDMSEMAWGFPINFLPADYKQKFVQESADMNFVFSVANTCVQSTSWRLGGIDAVTGRRYVPTGGKVGSPGVGTINSWFRIDRCGEDYKLVYCPKVCDRCRVVCGDIGVSVENGKRWLALSHTPLPVVFKKA